MDQGSIMIVGAAVALAALIVTMIGSLRRDIDKRFDGVEERFDERLRGVEKRFDERFAGIGVRFDGIDKRFADIDKRFDAVDKRFDGIDRRLDGIDTRLRSVEQGVSEANGRFAFVESYILGRNETAPGEVPSGSTP